jgi:TnpA family transposase
MTSLLDVLKETDLRVGFTDAFKTLASREVLSREQLQERLLLCLYGLGTNAGLKRMAASNHAVSYTDLLYVRRRFVEKSALHEAVRRVVNATLAARLDRIWGEGTTACASGSKKFGAWDQNLMTEWHIRYGGRGVMIYWHVERRAACIYSQLKRCSSSEVAAMIEGVLRHCTDLEVQRNYVDSHGQSDVAFAFCYLLGFQLMPRLKGMATQRLNHPGTGSAGDYPSLRPILTRPIDWKPVGHQYDEMIKYAKALRLGTARPEDILRRFTRNNLGPGLASAPGEPGLRQHPDGPAGPRGARLAGADAARGPAGALAANLPSRQSLRHLRARHGEAAAHRHRRDPVTLFTEGVLRSELAHFRAVKSAGYGR